MFEKAKAIWINNSPEADEYAVFSDSFEYSTGNVELKIAALSEMKETRTTIKINNDSEPEKAVTENASDEEGKKDEEEDGGATLTYSVFSKEDKQKMDGIKDSDGPELDKYEQDELGAEKVFPASNTEGQKEKKPAVVFVDPNSRSEARGMGVVDDMLSEQFEEVDGAVVNIPSYNVNPGQVVAVREKSKSLEVVEASLAGFNHSKYPWIEWDENVMGGKLLHNPERADIPENIKEQMIVELYSK